MNVIFAANASFKLIKAGATPKKTPARASPTRKTVQPKPATEAIKKTPATKVNAAAKLKAAPKSIKKSTAKRATA